MREGREGFTDLWVSEVKLAKEPEVASGEAFGVEAFGEFLDVGFAILGAVFAVEFVFVKVVADEPVAGGEEGVDGLRGRCRKGTVERVDLFAEEREIHGDGARSCAHFVSTG